jgi:hypothetical protein
MAGKLASHTMSETLEERARRAMEGLYVAMRDRGFTTTMMYDFGMPLVVEEMQEACIESAAAAVVVAKEFSDQQTDQLAAALADAEKYERELTAAAELLQTNIPAGKMKGIGLLEVAAGIEQLIVELRKLLAARKGGG